MKKRKNVLVSLLVLALVFCESILPVMADVMWEPLDSFYEDHYDECEYVSRTYTTNGPNGTVTIYESPVSNKVIEVFENGEDIYISHIYTNTKGVVWGVYEDFQAGITGWMPMDYMDVVYDYISFEEEYGEQFISESGSLNENLLGQKVYMWKYPGSEEYYEVDIFEYVPEYDAVFTDEVGHEWVYITYYMGFKNVWLCMDDPIGNFDTLFPNGAPSRGVQEEIKKNETENDKTEESSEVIVPDTSEQKTMIITALVLIVVVIIISIILIVLLLKKKAPVK